MIAPFYYNFIVLSKRRQSKWLVSGGNICAIFTTISLTKLLLCALIPIYSGPNDAASKHWGQLVYGTDESRRALGMIRGATIRLAANSAVSSVAESDEWYY